MTKKEIIEYVMSTPYNTNPNMLDSLLNNLLTTENLQNEQFAKSIEDNLFEIYDDTIKFIRSGAFYNLTKLEKAEFLEAETVSDQAFYQCRSLKELNLPKVINVGKESFSKCANLEKIKLNSLKSLSNTATAGGGCPIQSLPKLYTLYFEALNNIDFRAIADCPNLQEIYLNSNFKCNLLNSDPTEFPSNMKYTIKIIVPQLMLNQYMQDNYWLILEHTGKIQIVSNLGTNEVINND